MFYHLFHFQHYSTKNHLSSLSLPFKYKFRFRSDRAEQINRHSASSTFHRKALLKTKSEIRQFICHLRSWPWRYHGPSSFCSSIHDAIYGRTP